MPTRYLFRFGCLVAAFTTLIGTSSFAVDDNFNDGVDDGWTRYDPVGKGSWALLNGTYRIQSAPSPSPSTVGPGRAGSIRTTESYVQFYAAVDIVTWDNSLDQIFGLITRVGTPGLGTTRGYAFTYATRTGRATTGQLQILRVTGESGTTLAGTDLLLLPNRAYRLVFSGLFGALNAQLFAATNLATPIATLTASDSIYAECGVV